MAITRSTKNQRRGSRLGGIGWLLIEAIIQVRFGSSGRSVRAPEGTRHDKGHVLPRTRRWFWNDEVKLPIVSRRPVRDHNNNELPTSWGSELLCSKPACHSPPVEGAINSIFLAAVSQACRDTIDREVDALHHPLVRVPGAVALQKLDLHVVKRIEIREAVPDRAGQQGIFLE